MENRAGDHAHGYFGFSVAFQHPPFIQRLMTSSDDYAWTPRIFPLNEEPIATVVSKLIKDYLKLPLVSRKQAELWRLNTKDMILDDPILVLTLSSF